MKLVRQVEGCHEFQFGRREHLVFCEVLRAYPVIPLEHHQVTRATAPNPSQTDAQALLRETLAALKAENRRRVEEFLADARRFLEHQEGVRARFTREEMEWLLQVLNDVRVGSWIHLGCPDPDAGQRPRLTPKNARYLPLMEMAAAFEYALLAALDGTDGVGWGSKPPE